MYIDRYKLTHWLNARKVTVAQVSAGARVSDAVLEAVLDGTAPQIEDSVAQALLEHLNLPSSALAGGDSAVAGVLIWERDRIESTRRPIRRDGIHFYNYYSLPSPTGYVAPVILDILCPSSRLPVLNNGHLEPAITINLGPGDIHGRWAEELDEVSWRVLGANRTAEAPWIVGDSYVEPSYCPHTYSLTSTAPAQILSYTAKSGLQAIAERLNGWSATAAEALVQSLGTPSHASRVLEQRMRRLGYTKGSLARSGGIGETELGRFLAGEADALTLDHLKAIGRTLGMDYRLLLSPEWQGDRAGKVHCSVQDSARSVRPYLRYTVASMVSASTLPDLCGLFLRADDERVDLDLLEAGSLHYLVTAGPVRLSWLGTDGSAETRLLQTRDAAWLPPCVAHGWSGHGSLIKMGNGEGWSYADELEVSNTLRAGETIRRSMRDTHTWGYDKSRG